MLRLPKNYLNHYLENGELDGAQMIQGLRRRTLDGEVILFFVDQHLRIRVFSHCLMPLLTLLPSPIDVGDVTASFKELEETKQLKPDVSETFSALAFKIMTDPFVGKLTYLRIYSGN